MRVHVVTRDYNSDRILGRLARTLAGEAGWSLGATPNGSADLNYWICYVEYAEEWMGWHDTPITAYFTHKDEKVEVKYQWWNEAAKAVDLRIVTARQYLPELEGHGKTVVVRPPVDETFQIGAPPQNETPVVGLSGFVDKASGRKGEKLVAQLAASELGRRIELRAIGQGWPVRNQQTTEHPESDLPRFYQGLDVFLCTSVVEGNPLPPLEALACGVPVVIPMGVGLLDDLPDTLGIFRYIAGDYDDLCEALETACLRVRGRDYASSELASAVAHYTPENWADDHQLAFESLLYDVPTYAPIPHKRGMYCVAYGNPARDCAAQLIQTFKQYMPDVPVALASTEPLGIEDVWLDCPDVDIGGRHAKLKVDDLAPAEWESVLYLDADIEIKADISFLWELVESGWDFVICKNPGHFHTTRRMVRPDNEDECEETYKVMLSDDMLQFNGGVFCYQRNERTRAFFQTWHSEWTRWGKRDQAALLRALWQHPLKMCVLGNQWNTVPNYDLEQHESAGILHWPMRARRWDGVVHHRSDSAEAWKVVNR